MPDNLGISISLDGTGEKQISSYLKSIQNVINKNPLKLKLDLNEAEIASKFNVINKTLNQLKTANTNMNGLNKTMAAMVQTVSNFAGYMEKASDSITNAIEKSNEMGAAVGNVGKEMTKVSEVKWGAAVKGISGDIGGIADAVGKISDGLKQAGGSAIAVAGKVGNIAKFVGPIGAGISFAIDVFTIVNAKIKEAEERQKKAIETTKLFKESLEDWKNPNFDENTKSYIEDLQKIDEINKKIAEMKKNPPSENSDMNFNRAIDQRDSDQIKLISQLNQMLKEKNLTLSEALILYDKSLEKQAKHKAYVEQMQRYDETKSAYNNAKQVLEEYEAIKDLSDEYTKLAAAKNRTNDQNSRLNELSKTLTAVFPSLTTEVDKHGNAVIKNVDALGAEVKAYEETKNGVVNAAKEKINAQIAETEATKNEIRKRIDFLKTEIKVLEADYERKISSVDPEDLKAIQLLMRQKEKIDKMSQNAAEAEKELAQAPSTNTLLGMNEGLSNSKKNNQSSTGSTTSAPEYSETLDLTEIKIQQAEQEIEELKQKLEDASSPAQRAEIISTLAKSYGDKAEILEAVIGFYNTQLTGELEKLPADIRKKIESGGLENLEIKDEKLADTIHNIQSLRASIGNLNSDLSTIDNTQLELQLEQLAARFSDVEVSMTPFDDKLKSLKDQYNSLSENELGKKEANIYEQIALMSQLREHIKNQLKQLNIETDAAQKNTQEYKNEVAELNKKLEECNQATISYSGTLNELNNKKAQEIAAILKKGVQKQIDAEETRHKKAIDNLNEEKETFQDYINSKLNAIDEEESALSYNDELQTLMEEQQKLQKQLREASLDDSLEGKQKSSEISIELAEKEKEIEKLKHDRSVELRKDNLKKQLEMNEQETDNKIKAENEVYENHKDTLNALLNEDRIYSDARKILEAENLTDMQNLVTGYVAEFNKNMTQIGDRIKSEMIDNLNEAIKLLGQLKVSDTPIKIRSYIESKGHQVTWDDKTKQVLVDGKILNTEGFEIRDGSYYAPASLIEARLKEIGFARGGETQYTGWHWLDGKQGNPERVLDPAQTKLFNRLVDILPALSFLNSRQFPMLSASSLNNAGSRYDHAPALQIEKLIHVEGNIDKEVMPNIEKAIETGLNKVIREFNKGGNFRPVKL